MSTTTTTATVCVCVIGAVCCAASALCSTLRAWCLLNKRTNYFCFNCVCVVVCVCVPVRVFHRKRSGLHRIYQQNCIMFMMMKYTQRTFLCAVVCSSHGNGGQFGARHSAADASAFKRMPRGWILWQSSRHFYGLMGTNGVTYKMLCSYRTSHPRPITRSLSLPHSLSIVR